MASEREQQEILQHNLNHTLFSWSKQAGLNPISVERADGVYLYDYSGKRYLDFSSQLMNVNIGHGDRRVRDAVAAQMDAVSYVYPGMITKARGDLGKKLSDATGGRLPKVFFTLGGAEAIENAIKLARLYTGRHKIITRYASFHGASYGAFSAGGDPRRLLVDRDAMPSVVHVEDPYCYRCPWSQNIETCQRECVAHIERVIKFEGPSNVAAILMEGASGTSGVITYPPDYWQRLKEIATRYGILLIADEVMSGFGRTGKWFGIDHSGVTPDIITMAKGITAGYIPLGGILVTKTIADYFNDKPLPLGLTYSAHAVACAAGSAVMDIYVQDGLIEKAAATGRYIDQKVEELKVRHISIGDWRNNGMLGCIELVKNRQTKEPMAPWNAKPEEMAVMNKVAAKILELGMYTFVRWNWIFIAPPLTITRAEVDEGMEIISQAIAIADEHCN